MILAVCVVIIHRGMMYNLLVALSLRTMTFAAFKVE